MWISSSWHTEEVDWYQPELSATNGCMFLAGPTLRALCSLIEHLICVSPAHKLCRWCVPKSTRANFKFVFHYWKVTFYSRSHCVGRSLRQRRRFRPWYIYSICLVRQRFRHPNCAKPHIGISCHGNYSLSLIWFDCQGDSWMPKVWVSNNRSLLRLITRPVVCACQDFLCTLNCPWICEIYSCLVHHQYYRKTWNPISVCWIFSKHISLNTWDNNKTIGNQDERRRRRRRCPVRPVWPHQPRSSSKLPCPLTPPASSRPRTTWPLWLRTTCKQILDSFCWTFTSRSKNTTSLCLIKTASMFWSALLMFDQVQEKPTNIQILSSHCPASC